VVHTCNPKSKAGRHGSRPKQEKIFVKICL
jgi:hypothetical protein